MLPSSRIKPCEQASSSCTNILHLQALSIQCRLDALVRTPPTTNITLLLFSLLWAKKLIGGITYSSLGFYPCLHDFEFMDSTSFSKEIGFAFKLEEEFKQYYLYMLCSFICISLFCFILLFQCLPNVLRRMFCCSGIGWVNALIWIHYPCSHQGNVEWGEALYISFTDPCWTCS